MSARARAWVALSIPPVAWFGFEQGLSALLGSACARVGIGLAWGGASLALCGVALWLAWPLRRRGAPPRTEVWLARLATLGTAFFGLAIGFQTLAVLMVPPCLR